MEIPQAFVGEAGAALEAGGVGQSREVIVHSLSFCGQHVHSAVAAADSVSLQAQTHHLWCKYHLEYSRNTGILLSNTRYGSISV